MLCGGNVLLSRLDFIASQIHSSSLRAIKLICTERYHMRLVQGCHDGEWLNSTVSVYYGL